MRDAIRGLRTMFSSKGVKLVPLNEMVPAISVNKKAKLNIGEGWGAGRRPGRGDEGKAGERWEGSSRCTRWC